MSFAKFQELIGVRYMDKADDDGAAGGGAGDEGGEGGAADKTGDGAGDEGGDDDDGDADGDDDDGDADAGKGDKPTDREAKLIKESMKRKQDLKQTKSELEKANAKLKEFEGIDLKKVKELIQNEKDAETRKLEEKGQWDALKKQMADEHKAEIAKVTEAVETLKAAIVEKEKVIDGLTIGHSFDSSTFISEKLTLTPSKARIIYGSHFDVEDGNVVAYDKPKGDKSRVALVDGNGDPLGFESAIQKIVDADQDRDHILRSGVKPGSDSSGKKSGKDPIKTPKKGLDRIASGVAKLNTGSK